MRRSACWVILGVSLSLAACGGSNSSDKADVAGLDAADDASSDVLGDDVDSPRSDVAGPDMDATLDLTADLSDVQGDQDVAPDAAEDTAGDQQDDVPSLPYSTACDGFPVLGPQGKILTSECLECVEGNCCDLAAVCQANAECMAIRLCQAACQDSTCQTDCHNAHPDGQTDSINFAVCRSSKCLHPCSYTQCFGTVQAVEPSLPQYSLALMLTTTPDGNAVSGATVKHCDDDDAACAEPTTTATSNASGKANITVPSCNHGVDGYLEISSETILTTLYHPVRYVDTQLYSGSMFNPIYPSLFSQSTVDLISSLAGVQVDASRSVVFLSTRDCEEKGLGGAEVTVSNADAQTKVVYIQGGMPSTSLTETAYGDFSAVIFNVPADQDLVHVVATYDGAQFSSIPVHVRPGVVTTLDVVPTP